MATFPKLTDLAIPESKPWLLDNTMYLAVHGSHCYGLATDISDIDVRGIALRPQKDYLTNRNKFDQQEIKGEYDVAIFDLHKFVALAEKGNPNVLEILFVNEEHILHCNSFGKALVDNKELFLSKKIRHTLSGYAFAQLKRINNHYRWLKTVPTLPPSREEAGLPSYDRLPKQQVLAAFSLIENDFVNWDFDWQILENADRIALQNCITDHLGKYHISDDVIFDKGAKFLGIEDNFLEIIKRERTYKRHVADWVNYQKWMKERNPKRAAIEAKFGFDLKHASHLVRLMRMCEEFLKTGKLNVDRSNIDADELRAIKNDGIMTYEQLIEWATSQEEKIRILYKSCKIFPEEPDHDKIDSLIQDIILNHLGAAFSPRQ